MKILSVLLSKWFVPKKEYRSLESLLKSSQREFEAKRLIAEKVEYLGRLILDEKFSREEIETDEFYTRLELQVNQIRKTKAEFGYKLTRIGSTFLGVNIASPPMVSDFEYGQIEKRVYDIKEECRRQGVCLRKIAAIALRDGSLEESTSPLDAEAIDKILNAIAGLRGEIADLKEREQNYIEALRLSQQEVKQAAEAHAETKAWYRQQCEEMLVIATKISQGLD